MASRYTSASQYTEPSVDLNGPDESGVDAEPENPAAYDLGSGTGAVVIRSTPVIFVHNYAPITRAQVSIVNPFDCPDERLTVPDASLLTSLGLRAFPLSASAVMILGNQQASQYATALQAVRYSNTAAAPNTALRVVSVVVSDGTSLSPPAYATVRVVAPNNTEPLVFPNDGVSIASARHPGDRHGESHTICLSQIPSP